MTENGKSQIQTVGSAMLGFALVVGVGALSLMSRGGSAKVPSHASRPPAIPSMPAPEPARLAETAEAPEAASVANASSVLPSVMKEPAPAPEAAASPKPAALVVTRHLDATQTTSASASVAAAPAAKTAEPAKKEFVAPKLVAPKNGTIASSVHYGVSSRSELMGRAAGPVYNFKGRGAKRTQTGDGKIAGDAATKIAEIQRQVESSDMDEKSKKDLRDRFQLLNDGIGKAGSN